MSSKSYEKKCARLIQEATKGSGNVAYQTALRWTRSHQESHPDTMPVETRALRIIEERMER